MSFLRDLTDVVRLPVDILTDPFHIERDKIRRHRERMAQIERRRGTPERVTVTTQTQDGQQTVTVEGANE